MATQTRVKWKRSCGWYNHLHSASYLTLMVGDKGIKCPFASPKQCKKGPSGAPPLATMAILSASHSTAHRWLHSLQPRAPGKAPRATRWWMHWSVGTEWPPATASALPRPLSCRAWKLVAHRALPGRAARRGKFLENALVGLPGKLHLPGPCLLSLNTLFLNGSKGTTEDLGGRPTSLAAGRCNCPCTSSGY